jgi:chromosome segregation protein
MLKALELVGFKSFADRTRFEFPAGITVVVGPNGSGKSNIVDAIKWVLGEQSAKSLRGKDMADVIFKGAGGSAGRKPSNSAEATLIIDNETRLIDYDADEIHVSRRVFRSGEGEYLINGEACRLKDIRNLFRGTGVGTDAYSLIEQGKVDRMLQASAKDRRAIFEEAAGISRFKAKKVEAQRRLARVDQNLLRLSDIVEEVGNRYRSVKAQASKASRYKEYSERLKQLRTFTGMVDWREISEKLANVVAEIAGLETETAAANQLIEQSEKLVAEDEAALAASAEESLRLERSQSALREKIAALESSNHHQRTRSAELELQQQQLQQQFQENRERLSELQKKLQVSQKELLQAELDYQDAVEKSTAIEAENSTALVQLSAVRDEHTQALQQREEKNQSIQQLTALVRTDEGELKNISGFFEKQQAQLASLESDIAKIKQELAELEREQLRIANEAETNDSALAESRGRLKQARRELDSCLSQIAARKSEHNGLLQRSEVIQELEQKLDGVQAGVKQVLALAADDSETPYGEVHGLVADLVQVNVQHAPLVDVLLGDLTQYVVVSGDSLITAIASGKYPLQGRVGFLNLDHRLPAPTRVDLSGLPGVIGRADKLVKVADRYAPLIECLLGHTWVVKSAADVIWIRNDRHEPIRLATLDGDLFEANGTVLVGPRSAPLGLVSRRSELRSLKSQIVTLESELKSLAEDEQRLSAEVDKYQQESEQLFSKQTSLAALLADQRVMTKTARQRGEDLDNSLQRLQQEHHATSQSQATLKTSLSRHSTQLESVTVIIADLVSLISERSASLSRLQKDVEQGSQQLNELKIEVAKKEQQVSGLEDQVRQLETVVSERSASQQQLQAEWQAGTERRESIQQAILTATSELAELYLNKDQVAEVYRSLVQQRDLLAERVRNARETLRTQQTAVKRFQSRKHDIELSTSQLVHQRDSIAERMLEDYGIDLANLAIQPESQVDGLELSDDREAIHTEINDLRRKINNIGAVNTDALAELEDLEQRYTSLDNQYQDLVHAKETLDKIIVRINADSRRLFAETLEAIRQNFQVLYRRTFGGGNADIILEEGVDILDAGIEIIATPPGKPQFNNSLLSGGEKALTAVSLLLAIFQFRPSPFCVLDEVDAPFDEANIGRFVDVLRSFLGWTKFVIVSHSKKTMTAANTLHGVTMEESGVSTRVSVRFEDVSEDGHINRASRANSDDAA